MSEPDCAQQMLSSLHALGVRLALDDFGVGHSSRGQLARSLPISVSSSTALRRGMASPRDRGIVEAAVSLAAALQLVAVAEGVETPEQAAQLAKLGFSLAQGCFFGRPVPAAELLARLERLPDIPQNEAFSC